MSKRIVTIGGGSGHAQLLAGLRDYDCELTAVVSTADDGGPNGVLAKEYSIPPPSDLRKCLLALARDTARVQLWAHRFSGGTLDEYTVGNILLTALAQQCGSMTQACKKAAKLVDAAGTVLPIAEKYAELVAVLESGERIIGETAIDLRGKGGSPIDRVELATPIQITAEAQHAIEQADVLIFTMGDLFTSVIPNLLVDGCMDAIQRSNARRVFICNRSTKPGETDRFSIGGCISAMEKYLHGLKIEYCIADNYTVSVPSPFEAFLTDSDTSKAQMIAGDFHDANNPQLIDGDKVARAIQQLCESL